MATDKASLQQPLLRGEAPGGAPAVDPRNDGGYRVPSFADGLAEAPSPPVGAPQEGQGNAGQGGAAGTEGVGAQQRQAESRKNGGEGDATRGNSAADGYAQSRGAAGVGSSVTGGGGDGRWGGDGNGRWGEVGALDEEQCGTPTPPTGTASVPDTSRTPVSVRSGGMSCDEGAGPSTHTWKTLLDASPSRTARQLTVQLSHQADADLVVLTPRPSETSWPRQLASGALGRLWALGALVQRQVDDARANPKLVWMAAKAGFAASLISVFCVLEEPFEWLTSVGIWAVITVDLVYESNIGTSLQKGVNRVLGTLCAGLVALLLSHVNDHLDATMAPISTVIFVFLGGAIPMFYRFRPPFKDRWNYAVSMMMITFHMLLLSNYRRYENLWLPLARFTMIILGFVVASLVNLSAWPIYAGDSLHALTSKNLEAAATVLERCVNEYAKGSVLCHVPNISSGKAPSDDKIYVLYHEIVMSDADVDRLLVAVAWEPPHGKFFKGYPWHLYEELQDALRYLVYDIIALDSCLRAEIQAPLYLRAIVEGEVKAIGRQCADALRLFASDVKGFEWNYPHRSLQGAELAALQLQHKISKHLSSFLQTPTADPVPSWLPEYQSLASSVNQGAQAPPKLDDAAAHLEAAGQPLEADRASALSASPPVSLFSMDAMVSEISTSAPHQQAPAARDAMPRDASGAERSGAWPREGSTSERAGGEGVGRKSEGVRLMRDMSRDEQGEDAPLGGNDVGVSEWMERQESLARNWNRTLEHITALSLVKFASLLLEIVAKMTFVIEKGEALALEARFAMGTNVQ